MPEKRKYRPIEAKLVFDYACHTYPTCLQWRKVRVGPYPEGKQEPVYGIMRRWADLVVFTGSEVVIIEAKVRPDPGAISQLKLYAKLFPDTPEFEYFSSHPIKLVFLTSRMDKVVKSMTEEEGIEFVVYSPKWIDEYWDEIIHKRRSN